jgi:integrase
MASITPYEKPGSSEPHFRAYIRRTGQPSISKIFKTKRAAQAWARQIEREQDLGLKHDIKTARETAVSTLFIKFRDEVSPTRKSAKSEITRINRLLKTASFMYRRLDQISPADIREWRDARLKEVSGASVARELKTISSIFTKARKLWDAPIGVNPCFAVEKPANADVKRNRRPTKSEIEAIVKASGIQENVPPTRAREYMGWCYLLAIETAMRVGEIGQLRVKDFHEDECYLQLTDNWTPGDEESTSIKNGESRAVPLSPRALEIMRVLCMGKTHEERLIPVVTETIGIQFRQVCKELKIENLHFHDARHEATTRLSKKLANVLELSAVTGHKTLSNLKRYYNPSPSELAAKLR